MTQRLPSSLTSLDAAVATLCRGLQAVTPEQVLLADALNCIAANMPLPAPFPPCDTAILDGWAFTSGHLVGASSYSPLPLAVAPCWVEAGEPMPESCDCVLDDDVVDASGPLVQVVSEAFPGQGVRRAGGDIAAREPFIAVGHPIRVLDLVRARAAGYATLRVRRPRLRLTNMSTDPNNGLTSSMIGELARAEGAAVSHGDAACLTGNPCDLLITIGGTGVGRRDAAVTALAERGTVLAHGLSLLPGRTTAIGTIAKVPVIALPGRPDQAVAGWWTLALPALDVLTKRFRRPMRTLPLARKIASAVGVSEIALLRQTDSEWAPLTVGDLSLDAIAGADAWRLIPSESEGFAAGALIDAYMLKA
nr:molybdopterin-binding protein [Tardiphaga sp.]